jgi:hypothetical protein
MLFASVCNIHTPGQKRVIRSDKPITSVFPVKSHKCDFGAEPRCRLFVTFAGKGLIRIVHFLCNLGICVFLCRYQYDTYGTYAFRNVCVNGTWKTGTIVYYYSLAFGSPFNLTFWVRITCICTHLLRKLPFS